MPRRCLALQHECKLFVSFKGDMLDQYIDSTLRMALITLCDPGMAADPEMHTSQTRDAAEMRQLRYSEASNSSLRAKQSPGMRLAGCLESAQQMTMGKALC